MAPGKKVVAIFLATRLTTRQVNRRSADGNWGFWSLLKLLRVPFETYLLVERIHSSSAPAGENQIHKLFPLPI